MNEMNASGFLGVFPFPSIFSLSPSTSMYLGSSFQEIKFWSIDSDGSFIFFLTLTMRRRRHKNTFANENCVTTLARLIFYCSDSDERDWQRIILYFYLIS